MTSSANALGISAFLVALSGSPSALASETALRTIFAVDISGSSTFLVDQNSANAAGAFVEAHIAGLEPPHELVMVSIGNAGLADRAINIRATVTKSRTSSAKTLSGQFGGYFSSLPKLAASGKIKSQGTTSLIDFFRSLEPVCAKGRTDVVIFSDGVEWSSTVDGQAFVSGKVSLPKPESAFLAGCSVTLLGIGQVKSGLNADGLAARLIPQWRAFLKAAGADPVSVVGGGFAF